MAPSARIRLRRACALVLLAAAVAVVPASASGDEHPTVAPVALQPVAVTGRAADAIPAPYLAAYHRAARAYGVDWRLLAALGALESHHGTSPLPGVHAGVTASGAAGP